MNRYDIIIAGGGLAGLSLALEMSRHDFFQDKSIAILERSAKNRNDRTWCFWAKPGDAVPPYIFRQWANCRFYTHDFERLLSMGEYQYYMVRGIDFYQYAEEQLAKQANIRRLICLINGFHANGGLVHTDQGDFSAEWIFNSALSALPPTPTMDGLFSPSPHSHFPSPQQKSTCLWQHFKGHVLRTSAPAFDPDCATLMDFRTEHEGDTRFFYVLPFNEREALVEYTIFSDKLATPEHYDQAMNRYLQERLGLRDYIIQETEFGVIPMSDQRLSARQHGRLVNIGTAGGFVKASSGYAFKNTRKRLKAFVADWAINGRPRPEMMDSLYRRRLYDSVLLRVLGDKLLSGEQVFGTLFKNMTANKVFSFLDEESLLSEEFAVMNVMPKWPFLQAVFRQMPTFPRV